MSLMIANFQWLLGFVTALSYDLDRLRCKRFREAFDTSSPEPILDLLWDDFLNAGPLSSICSATEDTAFVAFVVVFYLELMSHMLYANFVLRGVKYPVPLVLHRKLAQRSRGFLEDRWEDAIYGPR